MSKPIPMIDGLPWIGVARDFMKSPIDYMEKNGREYDEIVGYKFFGFDSFMVTSPETVREVLVTKSRHFRKADMEVDRMGMMMGKGLVTNNDSESHKKQRKMAQPAFHHQRIAAYAETIVNYTDEMMDAWRSGDLLDIAEQMQTLTMYIVSKTLFDADKDSLSDSAEKVSHAIEIFQERTDEDFGMPVTVPLWMPTKRNKRFKESKQALEETLTAIINERRTTGEDAGDLLSMLLIAQDDDGSGMSDRQLLDEVITIFIAGHETTSNALMWTLYLLTQNPDVMARLMEEVDATLDGRLPTLTDLDNMPYALTVIKEGMRVFPPVYALNGRIANEDVEIAGYQIPKGAYISISPWAMHHNPRYFENPEHFDPERFNAENEPTIPKYAYIPFGAGPRVCIGNNFAMMEAHLILTTMVQRFGYTLSAEQEIDRNAQITLSNKTGMHMHIAERVGISAENTPPPVFAD